MKINETQLDKVLTNIGYEKFKEAGEYYRVNKIKKWLKI